MNVINNNMLLYFWIDLRCYLYDIREIERLIWTLHDLVILCGAQEEAMIWSELDEEYI